MGKKPLDRQEEYQTSHRHRPVADQQDHALTHGDPPAFLFQRSQRTPLQILGPAGLVALQSTVGNRAVQRLIARVSDGKRPGGVIQRRWSPPALQEQLESIVGARTHDETVWNHYTFEARSDDRAVPPSRFDDTMWPSEEGGEQSETGPAAG